MSQPAKDEAGERIDPLQEIRSTKETALKIANEGPSQGSDVPRLLAGLVGHLAEQIERLASAGALAPTDASSGVSSGPTSTAQPAEAAQEEDASPEDAPAAPARDPNAEN